MVVVMRSVITLILLLIVVGTTLLYTMKGSPRRSYDSKEEGPRRSYGRGWETGGGTGGGWSWVWYGILPLPQYGTIVTEEQPDIRESPIEQQCSTDLDCVQGHCSMFGVCTNGFSS